MRKLTLVYLLVIFSSCRGKDDSRSEPSPSASLPGGSVGITINARGELPALEVAIAPSPLVEDKLYLQGLASKIAEVQSTCLQSFTVGTLLDWTLYIKQGTVVRITGQGSSPCLTNTFQKTQISSDSDSPEQYLLHIQLRVAPTKDTE